MGGCCLGALLLTIGPRVILFFALIFSCWYDAFESSLIAYICWLFLPWTSLAWMYTFFHNEGNIEGEYLFLIIAAVVADVCSTISGKFSSSRND